MNTIPTLAIALVAATLFGATSAANAQGLTRAQVLAELAEAQRTGNIVLGGETGLKANELYPQLYPAPEMPTAKTRQQVRDELAAALRSGDFIADGESGLKAHEVFPHRYPARPVVMGKTRQQVRDELLLAIRLGDAPSLGEHGLTPAQRSPESFAAVRAEHQRALMAQQASTVSQNARDTTPR
ncbi:MAG: DUF4148 domain-containing protein [Rubrivivax sp.]|nr:DUF4148 domain-containing protein [Rubrivivax sp.]